MISLRYILLFWAFLGCVGIALPFVQVARAADKTLSEAEIKQILIVQSIANYAGNCPCPYHRASNGSKCGKRSAWSRAGGEAPLCYKSDVTPQMVAQYRANHPS